MITNAVRCVPPANKPETGEVNMCGDYLRARISLLPELSAILALGRIAHAATLRSLGLKLKDFPFAHGRIYDMPIEEIRLYDSYHCSRYNTNTGILTPDMFNAVFQNIRDWLDQDHCSAVM